LIFFCKGCNYKIKPRPRENGAILYTRTSFTNTGLNDDNANDNWMHETIRYVKMTLVWERCSGDDGGY